MASEAANLTLMTHPLLLLLLLLIFV